MEAQAGGNVEVGVNVMNVVESPEPREFVVCDVPVVKAQIEQQKAGDKLRPPRKRHEVDQTERSIVMQAVEPSRRIEQIMVVVFQ